jgi:hypothetical protein
LVATPSNPTPFATKIFDGKQARYQIAARKVHQELKQTAKACTIAFRSCSPLIEEKEEKNNQTI